MYSAEYLVTYLNTHNSTPLELDIPQAIGLMYLNYNYWQEAVERPITISNIKTTYTQYLKRLQSGTSIAIDTLLSTTSDTSYHLGQTEEIMKEYLYHDEDSGDISVSPEAVSISEIVATFKLRKLRRN